MCEICEFSLYALWEQVLSNKIELPLCNIFKALKIGNTTSDGKFISETLIWYGYFTPSSNRIGNDFWVGKPNSDHNICKQC